MNNATAERRSSRSSPPRAYQAEQLVARLFVAMGYRVQTESLVAGIHIDLVAEKDLRSSFVEVIGPFDGHVDLNRVRRAAARLEAVAQTEPLSSPIIVVLGTLSLAAREWAEKQYHTQIWDLDRLRSLTAQHNELHADLLALISGAEIEEAPKSAAETSETTRLIAALEAHIAENKLTPTEYEALCREVFSHLFDPVLYGFQKQVETSDGGNRYDFICRIKPGDSFWDSIRHDFRTRAIIFECKNYKEEITADQVYSTERYLFTGALRTVCFLISRFGPDAGCRRAAQGAMREAGKLILLLSNEDLIQLLKLRATPGGPEGYLDEMIWDFVVTLPR